MKREGLKIIRIIVSMTVFLAVTALWGCYGLDVARYLSWVTKIQIFPMAMTMSLAMAAFWACVAWIFGRIYCSTACPLGTWLDIVGHLGRMSRKGAARDYHYSPPLTRWRYTTLTIVIVCLIGEVTFIPALVDPYSIYGQAVVNLLKPVWGHVCNLVATVGDATGWWTVGKVRILTAGLFYTALSIVQIAAVSIPAWHYGRTYCNAVCPIGTVLGACSDKSVWHIDIDTDLCTNCRKCEYICKSSCINLADHVVDGSRCVNCFDCIAVCPDDAIFYRITRKQLSLPMMQSIAPPGINTATSCTATPEQPMANDNYKSENTESNETIS